MKLPAFCKSRAVAWIMVCLWAAMIFYWSSIPYLRITEAWWDIIVRKIVHAIVFGILAVLLSRALSGRFKPTTIFYSAFVGTVLYAISDEWHQHFVMGRHGSPVDVAIDSTGGWLALWIQKRITHES